MRLIGRFSVIRFSLITAVVLPIMTAPLSIAVRAESSDPCPTADAAGCSNGLPTFTYQALLTQMLAHPGPNVRTLQVDQNELTQYSFDRLIGGATPMYDAPNGNQVGSMDAGFNYVTIIARQGDFVEILPGKWTPTRYLSPAHASEFTGVLIDQPLEYPMGWIVQNAKPSPVPGIDADPKTTIVPRYTRINIFATKHIGQWDWYLIGPGQWVEQRHVSRVLPATQPANVKGRWIAVDLYEQVLTAYQDGQMVFATLIASGLPNWDTNIGLFRIWARSESMAMSGAMGRPDFYSLQAVPWVMFFDSDISLHGTYWHDGFGYRHSHGCVNMSITDSHWVFDWTNNFFTDSYVNVWTSAPAAA
jgi:hypothetical protein